MLRRLFFVQEGEFGRLLPFLILYLLLGAAFTLADGISQALFIQNVGAAGLPSAYALVAVANLVVMFLYLHLAERAGSVWTFACILGGSILLFLAVWLALSGGRQEKVWLAALYAGREIGFTLVLMHFGTFLNDYFTRDELNRVLPIIYSGGRLGGILGGWLLQRLAEALGLVNLLWLFVGLCGAGAALMALVVWRTPPISKHEDHLGDPGVLPPAHGDSGELEARARASFAGFLRFVWVSPLLFWVTVTSIVFILCRWVLNFQYSGYFERHFESAADLAEFLGMYTQLAMLGSLLIQLFVVNRLVAWLGLKGAHLTYGLLLTASMGLCLGNMTLGLAVFARLVETELRFGLRNPIMQLITNKFSKLLRVRVRAWTLGMIIPLSTLLSAFLLGGLVRWELAAWAAWLGAGLGAAYLLGSFWLIRSFREGPAGPSAAENVGVENSLPEPGAARRG